MHPDLLAYRSRIEDRLRASGKAITDISSCRPAEKVVMDICCFIVNAHEDSGDLFVHVPFVLNNRSSFRAIGAKRTIHQAEKLKGSFDQLATATSFEDQVRFMMAHEAEMDQAYSNIEPASELESLLLKYAGTYGRKIG